LKRKQGENESEIRSFTPTVSHDTLTLCADDWIEFVTDENDNKSFHIVHANRNDHQRDNNYSVINGLDDSHPEELDATQITHESCLVINDLEFDAAGHIIRAIPKHYTMPSKLYWGVLEETSAAATEE
jgi:hypothetical protein